MRIDDSQTHVKVWLTPDEKSKLVREMLDQYGEEGELVAKFGTELWFRSDEYNYPSQNDIERSSNGEAYFVRVRGKNTKGGGKTTRRMFLSKDLESDIYRYCQNNDISREESILQKSTRTYRRWVKNAGESLASKDGEPDEWQHLTSHDLRRYGATQALVEEQMNPRVVMACGGWSSFSALEPYLDAPTESIIVDEFTSR